MLPEQTFKNNNIRKMFKLIAQYTVKHMRYTFWGGVQETF